MQNYCGPGGFTIKTIFNDACRIHDEDYNMGVKTQKQSDIDFLYNMLGSANSIWQELEAIVLYLCVRVYGHKFYNKK